MRLILTILGDEVANGHSPRKWLLACVDPVFAGLNIYIHISKVKTFHVAEASLY